MPRKFFQSAPALQTALDRALEATWHEFPQLSQTQIAITWVVYPPPCIVNTGGSLSPETFWQERPPAASYRGVELIYPASVVKLFYLVAMHEWLEQGMIQPDPELDRAASDMIVDSSNDATGYLIDVLTGTTSGPALPPGPYETWKYQRNLINRYFQSWQWPELGGVNLNQKTWCDGPYGREREFVGATLDNRNQLSTEATARLLHSIIGGVSVSSERSQAMMALMQRSLDPNQLAADPENQVTGFLGAGLPASAQLWSKAGLTSRVRHDAAYVEYADSLPYLLIVFIEGQEHSNNPEILPFVSAQILAAVDAISRSDLSPSEPG